MEKDFLDQWKQELSIWEISMKESKRQKKERLKKIKKPIDLSVK